MKKLKETKLNGQLTYKNSKLFLLKYFGNNKSNKNDIINNNNDNNNNDNKIFT